MLHTTANHPAVTTKTGADFGAVRYFSDDMSTIDI